ncbi:MAG: hypothetical protein QM504_01935, partial [Pseudomonadota bacterium]
MKLKYSSYLLICISCLFTSVNATELAELQTQMQLMQQQMQQMQQTLKQQQLVIEKQQKHLAQQQQITQKFKDAQAVDIQANTTDQTMMHTIADKLSINGEIAVNARSTNSREYNGEGASDIILDTLAIGFDAQISSWVNGHLF